MECGGVRKPLGAKTFSGALFKEESIDPNGETCYIDITLGITKTQEIS